MGILYFGRTFFGLFVDFFAVHYVYFVTFFGRLVYFFWAENEIYKDRKRRDSFEFDQFWIQPVLISASSEFDQFWFRSVLLTVKNDKFVRRKLCKFKIFKMRQYEQTLFNQKSETNKKTGLKGGRHHSFKSRGKIVKHFHLSVARAAL